MDWRDFAQRMSAMAHGLLEQPSVKATLERITGSATELAAGCDAAGILLLSGAEAQTLAPTNPLVLELDQLQHQLDQGPCFDAARRSTGERVFRIADFTEEEERWPDFLPQAEKLGVGSMMGFLLYTEDEDFGALNFYSREPGAFTADSETAGVLLASHAAVALSSARTHAQMQQAVATRHLIGEAMDILTWPGTRSPRTRRSTFCFWAPHRAPRLERVAEAGRWAGGAGFWCRVDHATRA